MADQPVSGDDSGNAEEAGEASRRWQALFRSVVEGSIQGIIVQQDGRIVYANPAMAELFGYASPADMIGMSPFEDLIADEDVDLFRRRTTAVYGGERVRPHPGWRARHATGKQVWISSTAHKTEWKGRPAVASFYADITERKLSELAEREMRTRYRSALTAGRMAVWETDLVAGVRTWTEEGMALFGISLPEGRGNVGGPDDEYARALHPDDRHLVQRFHALANELDAFPAEYRVVRPDGTTLWLSGRGQVLSRLPDGRAHRLISIMADITERKEAELHVRFLLSEMSHRSKNLLSVVQAIARQTARSADSMEAFEVRFGSRLQGLATSHDVMSATSWQGASLGELVRQHLLPFDDAHRPRVDISGEDVRVGASTGQGLGIALHELATNAAKYGALSVAGGTVTVRWQVADGLVRLSWVETGGPPVVPPTRQGFGHFVLHRIAPGMIHGTATVDYAVDGLRWTAAWPVDSH